VLTARGVRCFYDADEQIELWGKYLSEELPAIYAEQVAAVVVFISAEYAARDWTRLERRAALNRAVRERREYVLPARFDDTPLPGLLSDMVAVDLQTRTPQQFAAMIADKLARLTNTASAPSSGAGDPAPDVEPAPSARAVRVGEADPRRLGVHAAISVPGVPDEVPPEYVLRDGDAAEHGVRARVAVAAQRGGFVLFIGGSSVGKTRTAVEAVKELLPDWWLVHPAGPEEVAALAVALPRRMVMWLDELQRYLGGKQGLTGGVVRVLLNGPHPVVIIGTMWPDWYTAYTTVPAPGGADPFAREREVLDLAAVIRIGPEFSPAEQDRARAAALRDPRLRVALKAAGYGLTQTLAAAPQLAACWEDAQTASPYAWAMLTAALDAARLGARAPLSAEFLRTAVPDYCTSQQQAEAPEDWFEQALTYATRKLHGAAAALSPAGADMGEVAGYTVADYLIQHVSRERRAARVPASTWDALLRHIHDPVDTARLARSAESQLLYRYAIPLYRHAADIGNGFAAGQLAELLARRGDLEEAEQIVLALADADSSAAVWLDALLGALQDLADADNGTAAKSLDELLDALRAQADVRNRMTARPLATLLANRGEEELRARADARDRMAARRLAELLADRGDADNWHVATQLAGLLAGRGDLQWLRARADAGDEAAAEGLAELLAHRGDLDGLRARADAGDWHAAGLLAGLLAKRGDLEGLLARINVGESWATIHLTELLKRQGRGEEAKRLYRFGLNPDSSIASA